MKEFSNLANVIYKRTYARVDNGKLENWEDTVDRVIKGNTAGFNVSDHEKARLKYFMLNRKAIPARTWIMVFWISWSCEYWWCST